MKKPSKRAENPDREEARNRIIGLGERSVRKNYYPQLRARLNELERFRALLDHTQDMMLLLDVESWRILDANAVACRFLGDELIDTPLDRVLPKRAFELIRAIKKRSTTFETQLELTNGSICPMEISFHTVILHDGTFGIMLGRDIHIRKIYEEKLIKQANYDELTGLANRALFSDRLAQSLLHAKRRDWYLALLFIDLDRFKQVNDTLGHVAGDTLLREAAKRISCSIRSDDSVARLGGDEFTVIVPEIDNPIAAELVAEKINSAMRAPFLIEGSELYLSASIGIAVYPGDAMEPQRLMQHADAAMYRAKEAGRDGFCFYTPEMNRNAHERMQLEAGLRQALKRSQFHLVYQPLVSLEDHRISGAEVLLRWTHEELGSIPPEKFIPVAEETGLIVEIGRWVLQQSIAQANLWSIEHGPFHLAVNVSSNQFKSTGFVTLIQALLEPVDTDNLQLSLEITEGLLMEDHPNITENLQALTTLGASLSIDDFGTGYCSLGYLKRFPISTLKIDKIFINELLESEESAALTTAIIAMGHSLGLSVTAEGIETAEQLSFLQRKCCNTGQGYYLSHPLRPETFTKLLNDGDQWNDKRDT